jgi:copper chaperone CopZ
VPVAAALVSSGLPVGAALIFLMAGPATNVATMGAVYRTFGKRTLGIYLGTIIGGSVLLGLVFDFVIPSEVAYSILEETPSTWWSVGSGLCLWLLLGWFALSDLLRAWRGRGWGLGEGSLQEFPVYGMTCGGCVSRIEHALSGVPGVDSVMVSLNPGLAQIQGTASEEVIEQAIREAGYTLHNPIGSD